MVQYIQPLRVLELFKGTGSVGKWIKEHHPEWEVTSLDILPKYDPTICSDILDWDYTEIDSGYFDIIWASPECKIFSMIQNSQIGRKWEDKEQLEEERKKNWKFPLRVLEIIEYFKPTYWFIENPWNSGMKDIPQMSELPSYRLDYCRFGYDYNKPTRIWSNINLGNKICQCKGKPKHPYRLGMSSRKMIGNDQQNSDITNQDQRYSVPQGLFSYIFSFIEEF